MVHRAQGDGGADVAEAININFNLGLYVSKVPGVVFGLGSGLFLLPRGGLRRWYRLADEAYERGRATAQNRPFHCVPFERLLPEPIEQVRAWMGIPPLREPSDSSDWVRSPIGKRMANGYGEAGETGRKAAVAKRIVEAGVPVKILM